MMQKLVKCALIGGLVLFLWGMLSWAILPWHKMYMHKFKDEGRVARVISDNAPESGIYMLPNMMHLDKDSEEMMDARDNMRQGPFMFASISLEGRNPDKMVSIVKCLILKIVAVFLVTWLLLQTKMRYNRRVGFVAMVGIVIALTAALPYWIWSGFSAGFTLTYLFEMIFGWFLTGLVIAKLAK